MKTQRQKQTRVAPPTRRRPNHLEEDAERFFAPSSIIENPDWLVGAN